MPLCSTLSASDHLIAEDSTMRIDTIINQMQGQPILIRNVVQLHPTAAGSSNAPVAVEVPTPGAHRAMVDIRPPDVPDTDRSGTHSNTDQTIVSADAGHDAVGRTPEAPPQASQDHPGATIQPAAGAIFSRELAQ